MKISIVVLLLLPTVILTDTAPTRAASVKGTLLCGKTPYEGAHVFLLRMKSEGMWKIADYLRECSVSSSYISLAVVQQ